MISSWIENLLPATRNLRPPLISGLLWALFLWFLYAEALTDAIDTSDWFKQVYALSMNAGSLSVGIVITVLVWVLGVLSMAVTSTAAGRIGPILLSLKGKYDWHIYAFKKANKIQRLVTKQQDINKQHSENSPIKRRIETDKKNLELIRNSTLFGVFIPRTRDIIKILGNYKNHQIDLKIANNLIENAAREAIEYEVQKNEHNINTSDIRLTQIILGDELINEFEPDPLDVLRVMDEKLYNELDRERSEREIRLGISLPLIVFGIFGWYEWNGWLLLCTMIGTMFLFKGAVGQSEELRRVINFVALKGLKTPVLRSAEAIGRNSLLEHLASNEQQQA